MLIPESEVGLFRRQNAPNNSSESPKSGLPSQTVVLVVMIVIIVFIVVPTTYIGLRKLRQRNDNPFWIPTAFLKRRWRAWQPSGSANSDKGTYSSQLQESSLMQSQHLAGATRSVIPVRDDLNQGLQVQVDTHAQPEMSNADRIDRHTSVRSVMTLPAYSRSVRDNERVLGREGERDGVDVVLEAPETEQDEEGRREDEMESLYQIRVARRREIAEREDRRRRRREARDRGDYMAAERIRVEGLQAARQREISGAAAMIAEHQSRNRDRRVSSVSYADLGVARHDGTRIRANSNDDERPLLDSAAPIHGSSSLTPWASRDTGSAYHSRNRSNTTGSQTSLAPGDDDYSQRPSFSSDVNQSRPSLGRFGSRNSDLEIVTLQSTPSSTVHSRNASYTHAPRQPSPLPSSRSRSSSHATAMRPSIDTHFVPANGDLGETPIPTIDPPSYDSSANISGSSTSAGFEDAPPYSSPLQTRPPHSSLTAATTTNSATPSSSSPGLSLLPPIARLPSIRIAEATPIEPPARWQDEWPAASPVSPVRPKGDEDSRF